MLLRRYGLFISIKCNLSSSTLWLCVCVCLCVSQIIWYLIKFHHAQNYTTICICMHTYYQFQIIIIILFTIYDGGNMCRLSLYAFIQNYRVHAFKKRMFLILRGERKKISIAEKWCILYLNFFLFHCLSLWISFFRRLQFTFHRNRRCFFFVICVSFYY